MKLFLTSSIGATKHLNGKRVAGKIDNKNGFVDNLKKAITKTEKLVYISGELNCNKNSKIRTWFNNTIESLKYEDIIFNENIFVDYSNCDNLEGILENADIVFLSGGSLPIQNKFFKDSNLKKYINNYKGIIVAQSAGSMNCAEKVYICPETLDEVNDSSFIREDNGLGLTDLNIIPHYNSNKELKIGDLRFYEDIIYPDTFKFKLYLLSDGAYIYINDEDITIYGECYMYDNGIKTQLCSEGKNLKIN